jgi:hypothetical protein
MRLTHLVTTVLLILAAGAASADFFFQQVSEAPALVGGTSVACSEDGIVVVAWSIPSEGVYTRHIHLDMVEAPVFHGPGQMPSINFVGNQFFLAWASNDSLIIRKTDSYDPIQWNTYDIMVFQTPSGEDVLFPRLTAMGMPQAMVVWEERGEAIWKSTYHTMWFDPIYVAPPTSDTMSAPQAEATQNMDYRVYMMNEPNTGIRYYQSDYSGGPFTLYDIWPGLGYFGPTYDVCAGPTYLEHAILSMGPQPTCPCNTVIFVEEYEQNFWTEPIHLTVQVDSYDFPQFPCIAKDDEDLIHTYWFQSAHNDYLEETHRGLYYFTRGNDMVWHDQSSLFGNEAGIWCSMAMGPMNKPVFVYAKGDYPYYQVWLGRDELLTGAPETPAAVLHLSAAPNPFNPKTTLRFTLPEAGHAELAIFELNGRHVVTLLDEHRAAGEVMVEWDASGLASGIYFAEATVPGYSEVEKLVLLK